MAKVFITDTSYTYLSVFSPYMITKTLYQLTDYVFFAAIGNCIKTAVFTCSKADYRAIKRVLLEIRPSKP